MTYYQSISDALINGSGRERSFLCHVHGDSNPSASVNAFTGAWICYACHASGKVDLDGVDMDPYAVRRFITEITDRIEASEVRYPENWLNYFDASGPGDYWLSRYSPQVCAMHRLGQSHDGAYATIPLRTNAGEVSGVVRRSLTGGRQKYLYPYMARLSERMYNYHRANQDMLILVEGATDAIALDEVAPGYSMALYGSRMSNAQAKLMYRYSPRLVLVATDQDAAGEDAMASVSDQLSGLCPVLRLTWDTYDDVSAIPLEERRELVSWAISEYGLPTLARVG